MNGHERVHPPGLAPAKGFSHAMVASAGRTVHVAGQIATDERGAVVGETFADQFDRALANVVIALTAAGARPEHVVAMTVYATDVGAYRASLAEVGRAWRTHFGRHYPAMALLGVTELVEPAARVEIVTTAVIPGGATP